jgi:hypothetical protein
MKPGLGGARLLCRRDFFPNIILWAQIAIFAMTQK